ncbi:MAG: adenylate/guanylate cyclase domain-containing protein [Alphaproteobacteria bacterium]|nr:adenylate/guanylate cyclase domain-containing protein [Alphaproteobacteria bacterium]
MLRVLLHYGLAVPALSLFGCEVCPYIEGMGRSAITFMLAIAFGLALALRLTVVTRLRDRAPPEAQARAQAQLDLGLFVAVAVAIGAYNTLTMGFPGVSGLKLALGSLTLGLFAATDLGLAHQRLLLRGAIAGELQLPAMERRATVSGKLAGFSLALVSLVTIDLAMLLTNEINVALGLGESVSDMGLVSELVSVMAVMVAHSVNLILSWTTNLKILLGAETEVLEGVAAGRLDQRVRVASDDELGQIAAHTNAMIEGLREREQVKQVLGKMVSPGLARELLDDPDRALRLGGERREVVVMFADIRGFTSHSEATPPAEVVAMLNRWFSAVVEVVHAQDGLVDKFLGDGVMVVFPGEGAADRAVAAAKALSARVGALLPGLDVGVGLHQGEVIAGNIGSEDRLEYTHIGDTVNTAARLEGLSKELGHGLIISEAVRAALSAPGGWSDLGDRAIRGRREAVRVWGWSLTPSPGRG